VTNINLNGFWKNNKKFLIGLAVALFGGGGGTLILGPEYVADFFKAPLYYKQIHDYRHHKEMIYEAWRLITDNYDSTIIYQVADDHGTAYDVDVRWVNGPNDSDLKIPIALVGKPMYRPYPIHIAHADGRWYINLHDNKSGETQNAYLYKKKPKQ